MPKASVPEPVRMVSRAGIEYSVEQVTPDVAELWLTRNTDNRRVRRATVDKYARDMESGAFLESGASICFAKDGTLLDGQHRLMAIVQSGANISSLVVRNLPNAAQDTMDDLAKRTLADTFGFHNIQNAHTAAAVVRRVLMWQNGIKHNAGGKEPTKAEALAAWREDTTLHIAVDEAIASKSGDRTLPPSIVGLAFWLFFQVDEEDCVAFMEKLVRGLNIADEGDPAFIVRNQINRRSEQAGRISETEFLAWVIKAWNHFRDDRVLAPSYRYKLAPREKFPEPR